MVLGLSKSVLIAALVFSSEAARASSADDFGATLALCGSKSRARGEADRQGPRMDASRSVKAQGLA